MKLFLSYSYADKEIADRVAEKIMKIGYEVITNNLNENVSGNMSEIRANIQSANMIIAIITENYLKSSWSQAELSASSLGMNKKILAIIIGDVPLPSYLSGIVYYKIDNEIDIDHNELRRRLGYLAAFDNSPVQNKSDYVKENLETKVENLKKAIESSSEFIPDICGEDSKDLLNLSRDIRAVANLVSMKSTIPPLSIGRFGRWGSGKTFFMKKIKSEINNRLKTISKSESENESHKYFCNNIVQIDFNAWHYMDTNLWASLVTHIFEMIGFYISNGRNFEKGDFIKLETKSLYSELQTSKEAFEKTKSNLESLKSRIKTIKDELEKKENEILNLESVKNDIHKQIVSKIKNEIKESGDDLRIEFKELDKIDDFCQEAIKIKKVSYIIINTLKACFTNVRKLWLSIVFSLILLAIMLNLLPELAKNTHGLIYSIYMIIKPKVISIGLGLLPLIVPLKGAYSKFNKFSEYIISLSEKQKQALLDKEEELKEEKSHIESNLLKQQQRVDHLKNKLEDIKSGKYLSEFIESKTNDKIYRDQLGIINVIRKDFDSLSDYIKAIEENRKDKFRVARNDSPKSKETLKESNLPSKEESLNLNTENDIEDEVAISEEQAKTRDEVASSSESQVNSKNIKIDQNEEEKKYPVDRIVLYIDDLDRCPPEKVVEVLQAVHLLLSFELFVVILAVDTRWVSNCLQIEYKNMFKEEIGNINREEDNFASTFDYLEKIIQIPIKINDMEDSEKQKYIEGLFNLKKNSNHNIEKSGIRNAADDINSIDGVESIDSDDFFEGKDREIRNDEDSKYGESQEIMYTDLIIDKKEIKDIFLFLPILGKTPRTLKRFVNIYRLLKASDKISDNDRLESLFVLSIVTGLPDHVNTISRIIYESTELEKIEDLIGISLKRGNTKLDKVNGLNKITKLNGVKDIPLHKLKVIFTKINKYSFY